MDNFKPSREACKILGVHGNTLRRWEKQGKIDVYKTEYGQRRYNVAKFLGQSINPVCIAYCRVSSPKQKDDLERQVQFMRERFPNYEIIRDVGSGLNYNRKGLKSILGRIFNGEKLKIVVTHRDRLARFGYELIQYIVQQNGGELLVLSKEVKHSPERELTEDLLTILHVFSCRMHGLRRYESKIKSEIKENKILPNKRTKSNIKKMD